MKFLVTCKKCGGDCPVPLEYTPARAASRATSLGWETGNLGNDALCPACQTPAPPKPWETRGEIPSASGNSAFFQSISEANGMTVMALIQLGGGKMYMDISPADLRRILAVPVTEDALRKAKNALEPGYPRYAQAYEAICAALAAGGQS